MQTLRRGKKIRFRIIGFVLILFSFLILILTFFHKENTSNSTLDENIIIPEMNSLSAPISEFFRVKANTIYFFKVKLESNLTIFCNLKEMNGTCINFYVLNELNLKQFLKNKRFLHAYVAIEMHGKVNISFITDKETTYYFIFDNQFRKQGICHDKLIYFELKVKTNRE